MSWYGKFVKVTKDKKYVSVLRKTYNYAWKHSDDKSTKIGVVLLDKKGKVILTSSNHFPKGTSKILGALRRPKKYAVNNHAERSVIYEAAEQGIKTDGLIMVMPWFPCLSCANAIISSGIEKLICHKQMLDKTPEDWKQEYKDSIHLLKANNIKVIMYDGKVGKCKGLFREVEWNP